MLPQFQGTPEQVMVIEAKAEISEESLTAPILTFPPMGKVRMGEGTCSDVPWSRMDAMPNNPLTQEANHVPNPESTEGGS